MDKFLARELQPRAAGKLRKVQRAKAAPGDRQMIVKPEVIIDIQDGRLQLGEQAVDAADVAFPFRINGARNGMALGCRRRPP